MSVSHKGGQSNALKLLSTFDVLETIAAFLESRDIETLFMTCKTMLKMSQTNNNYVYSWLIRAIIRELKLPISFFFNQSERRIVYVGLRQLKYHFYSHPDTPISDYLCYIVERNNQCDTLFHRLVESVYTTTHNTIGTTNNKTLLKPLRFIITSLDLIYILVYGNLRVVKLILKNVRITPDTISQAVNQLIYQRLNHARLSKVELLIEHFLAKACFPSLSRQQQMFINQVLFALIKGYHNMTLQRLLQLFVKYRNLIEPQYQLLIKECLVHDNLKGLKMCMEHMHVYSPSSKITIDPLIVGQMVEWGRTRSLIYVIEHVLGKSINLRAYIHNICSGIARSSKSELYSLQSVAHYFTDDNWVVINQYISLADSENKLDANKKK